MTDGIGRWLPPLLARIDGHVDAVAGSSWLGFFELACCLVAISRLMVFVANFDLLLSCKFGTYKQHVNTSSSMYPCSSMLEHLVHRVQGVRFVHICSRYTMTSGTCSMVGSEFLGILLQLH